MTAGVPSVRIAWGGDLTGVFSLDTSELDGPDTLGAAFGNSVYDDLSSVTKSVSYHRGRSSNLGMVQEGGATIKLVDRDGTYNPHNPASPLAGKLKANRPVIVTESYGGTVYTLFAGFTSDIDSDPSLNVQEATIACIDLYDWLGKTRPILAATGPTTVGAALALIHNAMEWTDYDFDTGSAIPDFSADGSKTSWALIEDLLKVDLGLYYVAGSGRPQYRDRNSRWSRTAPVDTFDGAIISGLHPGFSGRSIVNRQTVTRTGGVPQTYTDEANRRENGYADGSAIESAYLASDADAYSLATFLVDLQLSGRPPVDSVTVINGDEARLLRILTRELGDRVNLSEPRGGTSVEGIIESLDVAMQGNIRQAAYVISTRPYDMFTLDLSELDSTLDFLGL